MRLRVGSRASPLAVKQASLFAEALKKRNPELSIELIKLSTSGDRLQDKSLADFGGKGLFTKELDLALLEGSIDFAVHSAKDMPTFMPVGVAIGAYMEREDVCDAFVSTAFKSIAELPKGATIGTASLRRQTQLALQRPDLRFELLRGNLETRLRKIKEGLVDGTLFAVAGLKRGGYFHLATEVLDPQNFVPAVGQGAIAICTRFEDARLMALARQANHFSTALCVMAERTMLRALDGSCRTPIGGYAFFEKGILTLTGFYATLDGKQAVTYTCHHSDPHWVGLHVASVLKKKLQEEICP